VGGVVGGGVDEAGRSLETTILSSEGDGKNLWVRGETEAEQLGRGQSAREKGEHEGIFGSCQGRASDSGLSLWRVEKMV